MYNSLMIVFTLVVFISFVCATGVIYNKSERKREERMLMEPKKDADMNPNSGLIKMALHTRYNGLSTRGRINF